MDMLLVATRPGEFLYRLLGDDAPSDGLVVGANYARYVPLWGYFTRVGGFVPVDTEVHQVLYDRMPEAVALTSEQREAVRHLIVSAIKPYERDRPSVSGDEELAVDGQA